jgi:hypothetical protein
MGSIHGSSATHTEGDRVYHRGHRDSGRRRPRDERGEFIFSDVESSSDDSDEEEGSDDLPYLEALAVFEQLRAAYDNLFADMSEDGGEEFENRPDVDGHWEVIYDGMRRISGRTVLGSVVPMVMQSVRRAFAQLEQKLRVALVLDSMDYHDSGF